MPMTSRARVGERSNRRARCIRARDGPPLGKAGHLDDELDYQMPLAPNQVGEAAVEIARGGRFHSNRLTRVSLLSCEGRRRPWARVPLWLLSAHPAARPRTAGSDARALTPLLSPPHSRRQDLGKKPSSEKSTTAKNFLGPSHGDPSELAFA